MILVLHSEYLDIIVGQIKIKVELDGAQNLKFQIHEILSQLLFQFLEWLVSAFRHFSMRVIEGDEVEVLYVVVVDLAGKEKTQSR